MNHFSRTVLRNSAFGLAAQVSIKVLSFAFSVLVIRHLGAQAFGQYSAVLAFGAVFVFLADLGLSPFAVREIARSRDRVDGLDVIAQLYGNVLLLRLILSIVAAVVIIGSALLTGRPMVMVGAIALGTLGLLLYGIQGTSEAVLSGLERLDLSAGAKIASQIVFVGAGAALLWFGFGYYGLIAANLAGAAVMTWICWGAVQRLDVRPTKPFASSWPSLLRASMPFGVGAFVLGLSYNFDSILLSILRGDKETGYYNVAYNLIFSVVVLSNVLNTSLYPSLARREDGQNGNSSEIYQRALRYLMVLSLPLAVGIWAVADQLVPVLYTPSYTMAVPALQILAWVIPLMFASEFLGYVGLVKGKEAANVWVAVVSTGTNVMLNLMLIPRFGFIAAAIVTLITEAVLVAQYLWILRSVLRDLDWGRTFLGPLVAALAMGMAIRALFIGLALPIDVAFAAFIYVALLVTFRVIGQDEVRFARGLVASRDMASSVLHQAEGQTADLPVEKIVATSRNSPSV